MKQELPRFSFKDYSTAKDDFTEYIYSSQEGERVLCKVLHCEMDDIMELPERNDTYNFVYTYESTGMPAFFRFKIVKNTDLPEESMQSVFKDMAAWYKKSMEEEENFFFMEKNITEKPILKEYSSKIKDLIVIYSNKKDMWIYIYKAHVRLFKSDTEGDAWLTRKYNINKLHLKDGKLNISEDVDDYITRKCEEI